MSPHGQLAIPAPVPGSRPAYRLAGEFRGIVEERDGSRNKDIGWVLALNSKFYAGTSKAVIGKGLPHSTLDEAVEAILSAWMKADKEAGGV